MNKPLNGILTVEVNQGHFLARYECTIGFTITPKESVIRSCNSKALHLDKEGVLHGINEWKGTDPVCFGMNIMIYKRNIFSFIVAYF